MKTRWIVALFAVAILVVILRPRDSSTQEVALVAPGVPAKVAPITQNPAPLPTSTSSPGAVENPVPPAESPGPALPTVSTGNLPPAFSELRDEIDNVQFAVRDFRTAVGENPIGGNAEITKALLGDNLKQVKLQIPTGSTVNGEGEMCDRWGTPYFFHQISAKAMEVRSAGPDRTMWSNDDIVAK